MAIRIDFSKLIGNKYPLEVKMEVLNWMLKTGKGHDHQYGWNRDGIDKSLFDYSANSHDSKYRLSTMNDVNWYFDAVFSRAVFASDNKSLKEWRKKESIYPTKYRVLKFNDAIPNCKQPYLSWLINDIYDFKGKLVKKDTHHPEFKSRTEPKILNVSIYTTGRGWTVNYTFSFKEFNYENGWNKEYHQNEDESIWQFLKRSYDELLAAHQKQRS